MRTVFTGFDSAWTRTHRGAIAHLVVDGQSARFVAPEVASFDDALASINAHGNGVECEIIAIDQPLIVTNDTCSRPCEGVFRPMLGRIGGAIQPSNRSRVGMFDDGAPIWPFLEALQATLDPKLVPNADRGRHAFEVWPVAAQIAFNSPGEVIPRLLKYNPGRRHTFTFEDWRALNILMASTATTLGLIDVATWFSQSADLHPIKSDQDKVDAVICLLTAWIWWRDGLTKCAVIGDTATGYIVTPVSPAMTSVLGLFAAEGTVTFRTDVIPQGPVAWGKAIVAQSLDLSIRLATVDDAAAIARIYNQGIEDRVATLETSLRTPDERAEWLRVRSTRHPVLIATDSPGDALGWASLNQYNTRPAYDHVADISVYVDRDQRGRGIGNQLLHELEAQAREIGFHKLVLAAFPTNAPGVKLYKRRGFRTVGIYHEQGMLDGQWVDTIVMEKLLT